MKFNKRVHTVKSQNIDIKKLLNHGDEFIKALKKPSISKQFRESICLAVIEVNGCALCNYAHTKKALEHGMTQEEIESLSAGLYHNAPEEFLTALLFAQHYAEAKGNPDSLTFQKVIDEYGEDKANDILAYILLMMVANMHGNTMEALRLRLKGTPIDNSSSFQEIAVIFGIFKLVPPMLFKLIKYKIYSSK